MMSPNPNLAMIMAMSFNRARWVNVLNSIKGSSFCNGIVNMGCYSMGT
jgi:hypothetical protein